MFKSVICFGIFVTIVNNALAVTDEQNAQIKAKLLEIGYECAKDHPVNLDDISSFRQKVFPESENAACFTACVLKKTGTFDSQGKLTQTGALESAKEIFSNEKELKTIEEFITECSKVNDEEVDDGEKGCKRAKLAFNCYVDNYKKFNFELQY